MATDHAIARAFSEGKVLPTLRFYGWSVPTFSLGAFQPLEPGWLNYIDGGNLALVRRITGGSALLHNSEITYSVIASTRESFFSSGIKPAFHVLAKVLLEGLESLGVKKATIYIPTRKHNAIRQSSVPLCFSNASWYEITAKGKKLIGSAQKRWSTCFLQHGSLMLEKGQVRLAQNHPLKSFISENQIALSELLTILPSHNRLIEAFKSSFESRLGVHFVSREISPYERKIIPELIRKKYGNRDWNFYRGEGVRCGDS